METPGLPLFGPDELERIGPPSDEAREKAKLTFPIASILDESHMLPGQRNADFLDPSTVVCSQVRSLLTWLKCGGKADVLTSLWSNRSSKV